MSWRKRRKVGNESRFLARFVYTDYNVVWDAARSGKCVNSGSGRVRDAQSSFHVRFDEQKKGKHSQLRIIENYYVRDWNEWSRTIAFDRKVWQFLNRNVSNSEIEISGLSKSIPNSHSTPLAHHLRIILTLNINIYTRKWKKNLISTNIWKI